MGRGKDSDVSSRLEMRFDERLRYLSELAARAKGMTLRDYLEWAAERSFVDVELRKLPQRFRPSMQMVDGKLVTIDYSEEDEKDRADQKNYTLEHWKEAIWRDTPLKRLEALKLVMHAISASDPEQNVDHLVTPEQDAIWKYLWKNDKCLSISKQGKRLNYRYIEDHWQEIRDAALNEN